MREPPPQVNYPPIHTKPKRKVPVHGDALALDPNLPLRLQFGKPGNRDWFFFSMELRTLLHGGIPLVQALTLLTNTSERRRVRKAAAAVAQALVSGSGLSSALDAGRHLPQLVRTLLVQGNQSGRLSGSVDMVVRHYQWMLEIKSLILRSIWYPAVQVVAGALIMVGRDTTIAYLTGKMGIVEAIQQSTTVFFGPIVIGVIAAVLLTSVLKLARARRAVDAFVLTIPGIGGIVKKYAVAVFFEVLACAVESGMSIVPGYLLATRSTTNTEIASRLSRRAYFLEDGESLGETLQQTRVLTAEALGMVRAGESAGETPALMRKMADYYHDEIRRHARILISIYTPFTLPAVAAGYFINVNVLGWLAFVLVFLWRVI